MSLVGGWQEPEREDERGKSKPARIITTAKYKADGEGLIHDRRPQIFVVAAEGGEPRQITEGDFPSAWPAWSPDGTTIIFASERHETRDDDWADDIYAVGADGRDLRCLTDTAGPMWSPTFAPDGQSLVYVGTGFPTGDGRNFRLFSVSMDGGKPTCLTADLDLPQWEVTRPVWTTDGRFLLAVFRDHARYPIYLISRDSSEAPRVLVGGDRRSPGFRWRGPTAALPSRRRIPARRQRCSSAAPTARTSAGSRT